MTLPMFPGLTVQEVLTLAGAYQGVWNIRDEWGLSVAAVYRYDNGLWRCSRHPGIQDCAEIRVVKEKEGIHDRTA